MTQSSLGQLIPPLIESLRNELQHYGEMLALLDQQHAQVFHQPLDDIHPVAATINQQMVIIQTARQERRRCEDSIKQAVTPLAPSPFYELIPLLPEKYRGALRALVRETNESLARVRQQARQNELLLTRSLDLMQQFLQDLTPITSNESALAKAPRQALATDLA